MPRKAESGLPGEAPGAPSITSLRTDEVKSGFQAINGLLQHDEILTDSLRASLRELRSLLSERLCPYTTEQLDAHKKSLDERFPDYEHWYIRCGTTVTWCDRRRPIADA
jgi:hypothetical protein